MYSSISVIAFALATLSSALPTGSTASHKSGGIICNAADVVMSDISSLIPRDASHGACDISQLELPALAFSASKTGEGIEAAATSLPLSKPVGKLRHVAIGRGTQNYTCKAGVSKPASAGALATLYDASTLACHSGMLNTITTMALLADQNDPKKSPAASKALMHAMKLPVLGHHYFTATNAEARAGNMSAATPTFNLDTKDLGDKGYGNMKANESMAVVEPTEGVHGILDSLLSVFTDTTAAATAVEDDFAKHLEPATDPVAWLRLLPLTEGGGAAKGQPTFQSVYRVETVGGTLKSCHGHPDGTVLVDYAAQYFFFE